MKDIIQIIRYIISRIIQYILYIYDSIQQLIQQRTGKVIVFDSTTTSSHSNTNDQKRTIVIGKQIAEGGFSYIFIAYDISSSTTTTTTTSRNKQRSSSKQQHLKSKQKKQYVVKRIHCPDPELINQCRYEANVHWAVMNYNNKKNNNNNNNDATTTTMSNISCKNQYVMPLYGFTIEQNMDCYMLFPFCTESLRTMINRKNIYIQSNPVITTTTRTQGHVKHIDSLLPPLSELMVLQLFRQVCYGIQALHICGYSHRDMKLENILIYSHNSSSHTTDMIGNNNGHIPHLVVMDCGSAGSLQTSIQNRKQILEIIELASQHTTISYRPPELFDGGIQLPYNNISQQQQEELVLDYCAVDVWSLGCTLHAIMYGLSPYECEFGNGNGGSSMIKVVDCTHLSIIGNIPIPKYPPISEWYTTSTGNNTTNKQVNQLREKLLIPMLQQDPKKRPKVNDIIQTIESMIVQLGGTIIDMPPITEDNDDNNNNINDYYYDRNSNTTTTQYRDNYFDDLDVSKDSNNDDDNDNGDGIALLSRVA